jgi:hypothetical protein
MSVRHPIRGMDHIGITVGTCVVMMRMLQLANGPGIELFEMRGSDPRPATGPNPLLGLENGPGNKF